jgi:hypothetical protein
MIRKWRPWIFGGLALIVFALATALATPTTTRDAYDPQSAAPTGSRALAELLRGQGIGVERTSDAQQALSAQPGQTLVVANPQLLPRAAVHALEGVQADVVLLGPIVTPDGYLGITIGDGVDETDRDPACTLPAATMAGSVRTGGVSLVAPDSTTSAEQFVGCYPTPATTGAGVSASMLQSTSAGPTHTVFGSAEFLTNEWIDDSGNAALAMNVMGANSTVIWWMPSPVFTGTQPLTSLLPDGVWPILGAVVVLVVLIAFWQGRRLGPIVTEPIPVAVLASETTQGRARIYQRHRTRAQAAHHLRAHTEASLARRLGLPPGSDPDTIVSAVTAASGRPQQQVGAILYGPAPERDDELVTLGRQLADLDLEVRRS